MKKHMLARLMTILLCITLVVFIPACGGETSKPPLSADVVRTLEYVDGEATPVFEEKGSFVSIYDARDFPLSIRYEIQTDTPNRLVSVEIVFESMEKSDPEIDQVQLQCEEDINARYLTPGFVRREGTAQIYQQVFKTDSDGRCTLNLSATLRGNCLVSDPLLRLVEEDDDYFVYTYQEDICMVIRMEDFLNASLTESDIRVLAERLSNAKAVIWWLCHNHDSMPQRTDIVLSENCRTTALAGDPIYIDRAQMAHILTASDHAGIEKNDGLAILIHEISHTADREEYCFDSEFFAALKQFYALQSCGYTISPDFFTRSPTPDSGAYNYEAVLHIMLERMNYTDSAAWTALRDTLNTMHGDEYLAYTAAEKFAFFAELMHQKLGHPLFSEQEMQFLLMYYSVTA